MKTLLSLLPSEPKQRGFLYVVLALLLLMLSSQTVTAFSLWKRTQLLRQSEKKIRAAEAVLQASNDRAEKTLFMYHALAKQFSEKIRLSQEESDKLEKEKKDLQKKTEELKKTTKNLDLKGVLDAFKKAGY